MPVICQYAFVVLILQSKFYAICYIMHMQCAAAAKQNECLKKKSCYKDERKIDIIVNKNVRGSMLTMR